MTLNFKKIIIERSLQEQTPISPHQIDWDEMQQMDEEEDVSSYIELMDNVVSTGDYVKWYEKMGNQYQNYPKFIERMRQVLNKMDGPAESLWRGMGFKEGKHAGYPEYSQMQYGATKAMEPWKGRTIFSWTGYINRAMRFVTRTMAQERVDVGVLMFAPKIPIEQIIWAGRSVSRECMDEMASEWGFSSLRHYHSFEDEFIVSQDPPFPAKLVYTTQDMKKSKEYISGLNIKRTQWDEGW